MRRAAFLLALAACDRGVHFHPAPPALGTRSTWHLRVDGQLQTPDGVEHGMHQELGLMIEVESMNGSGHADRLRVTVDRHDNVYDGKPLPTLSGTYEVNSDGTAARADGKPLATHEVELFHGLRDLDDTGATDHVFHTGETFRPTDREAAAYGLPPSKEPLEVAVRRAADAEIVLAADYVPTDTAPEVEAHGKVVVTLTPRSHTRVGDIAYTSHGKDVGAVHATTELRRLEKR
ncbi:MAG TPA: hypothetical protein VLT45_30440 [Kofleriaceae bacterium]|nr:hypothetical protein [Kofleriaceae bacterium]